MGSGTVADLALKAACEACGAASDFYGTGCCHATLCSSCGAPITNLIREYNVGSGGYHSGECPFDRPIHHRFAAALKEEERGEQVVSS